MNRDGKRGPSRNARERSTNTYSDSRWARENYISNVAGNDSVTSSANDCGLLSSPSEKWRFAA